MYLTIFIYLLLDYPWPLGQIKSKFELLVNRVMQYLLGQRLFNNNIFCTTWIVSHLRKNQKN